MRARRFDWIQLGVLLLGVLLAALAAEARFSRLEQLATDTAARLERIERRLDALQADQKP